MSTVTQAVATRDETPTVVVQQYADDFARVLPSHIRPDTFVRLAQGVLRRDPKLEQAARQNPRSLLVALLDAARLGAEPGTEEYYLIPRKRSVKDERGRWSKVDEVTGQEGYRNIIRRVYASGLVSSVVAEIVCTGDTFDYVPGVHDRPVHHVNWFGDRGDLVGAYAYAVMKDGSTSKVVIVGPREIAQARSASLGADDPHSPWQRYPDGMYRKTALRRLEPYLPKSAQQQQAHAERDAAAETVAVERALPPVAAPSEDGPVEAEVIDDGPPVDEATGEIVEESAPLPTNGDVKGG